MHSSSTSTSTYSYMLMKNNKEVTLPNLAFVAAGKNKEAIKYGGKDKTFQTRYSVAKN